MAGKIITNILPTKSYLKKYKVVDDDLCDESKEESDSIIHNLWDCVKIVPILSEILKLVKDCTNLREIYPYGLCHMDISAIVLTFRKYFARQTMKVQIMCFLKQKCSYFITLKTT